MGARCYYLYWKLDHVEFTLALFTFSLALRPQAAVVVVVVVVAVVDVVVGFPFFVHGWLQQTTTAAAAGRGSITAQATKTSTTGLITSATVIKSSSTHIWHTHTHTHSRTHIYIYMYSLYGVCVIDDPQQAKDPSSTYSSHKQICVFTFVYRPNQATILASSTPKEIPRQLMK